MTATGHAIIGVVIAAKIGNPALAVPIALASHIAADLFPHWDPATNRRDKTRNKFFSDAAIDGLISVAVTALMVIFLFPGTSLIYAYLIVFAAQFFDWASAPYIFFKIKNPPIFYWFYKFQKLFDNKLDKPWGIIGQAAILSALVIFFKLN